MKIKNKFQNNIKIHWSSNVNCLRPLNNSVLDDELLLITLFIFQYHTMDELLVVNWHGVVRLLLASWVNFFKICLGEPGNPSNRLAKNFKQPIFLWGNIFVLLCYAMKWKLIWADLFLYQCCFFQKLHTYWKVNIYESSGSHFIETSTGRQSGPSAFGKSSLVMIFLSYDFVCSVFSYSSRMQQITVPCLWGYHKHKALPWHISPFCLHWFNIRSYNMHLSFYCMFLSCHVCVWEWIHTL